MCANTYERIIIKISHKVRTDLSVTKIVVIYSDVTCEGSAATTLNRESTRIYKSQTNPADYTCVNLSMYRLRYHYPVCTWIQLREKPEKGIRRLWSIHGSDADNRVWRHWIFYRSFQDRFVRDQELLLRKPIIFMPIQYFSIMCVLNVTFQVVSFETK